MWVNKKEKEMEMEMEKGRVECREKIGTTRKVMMLNKRGERQRMHFNLCLSLSQISHLRHNFSLHIFPHLFSFFVSFFLFFFKYPFTPPVLITRCVLHLKFHHFSS